MGGCPGWTLRVTAGRMLFATVLLGGIASHADATHCATTQYVTTEVEVYVFRPEGSGLLPVAGAQVEVTERTARLRLVVSGTTDESGHLRLNGLAVGRYFLAISQLGVGVSLYDLKITGKLRDNHVLGVAAAEICPKSCVVTAGPSATGAVRLCLENPAKCGDDPASRPTSGCS